MLSVVERVKAYSRILVRLPYQRIGCRYIVRPDMQ